MVFNPCNVQPYAAGFLMSTMCKLAVNYAIVTWSSLYIPQDFPLLFVIIFLSYCRKVNQDYRNTSAWWEWIRNEPIDRLFIQCSTRWHTATQQTPFSPPQSWQCNHRNYDSGCTFQIVCKTGSSKNKMQCAIGCEHIHIEVNGHQLTV